MRKIYSSQAECYKAWKLAHPGYDRNYNLKWNYGITQIDYDRIYQIQQGRCKVCNQHQSNLRSKLCVDHNHQTGEIRGLLCRNCNLALGIYEKYRNQFISYLEEK